MSKCLIMCHLGLGDNITMIGMCRYLCQYYEEVHIPSKEHNYKNVVSFFQDEPKIKVFIITDDELRFLPDKWKDCDIYNASLSHRNDFHIRSNIKLRDYENHFETNNFLIKFYNKVNIAFRIYSEYFKIPITERSSELYNSVKKYNIIFVHESCSNHKFNILQHLSNISEDDIVLCSDSNYYKNGEKFVLACQFLNIHLIDYFEIICNAKKIMISDSCFSSMVIPLKLKGSVKTDDITFFTRCDENIKIISEILPISKFLN